MFALLSVDPYPSTPPTLLTKFIVGSLIGASFEGLIRVRLALDLLLTHAGLLKIGIDNSALTLYSIENMESGTGLTLMLSGSQSGRATAKLKTYLPGSIRFGNS